MDLTFLVPMQNCSLQNRTLLPSPVTSTTACCFHFCSIPSFFLELFLHSSPVAYWAPTDLGSSSLGVVSSCLFVLFMGFSRQECWSGCHFLLQWTMFPQNSPANFPFYQHLLLECWLSSGQLDLRSVTVGQFQLCVDSRVLPHSISHCWRASDVAILVRGLADQTACTSIQSTSFCNPSEDRERHLSLAIKNAYWNSHFFPGKHCGLLTLTFLFFYFSFIIQ